MGIFALDHRSPRASPARRCAEGSLPPDLDIGRFSAAPSPTGAACDVVVDAALVHARAATALGGGPLDLARAIAADSARVDGSASVEVAGPGFVDVTLRPAAVLAQSLRCCAPAPPMECRPPRRHRGGRTFRKACPSIAPVRPWRRLVIRDPHVIATAAAASAPHRLAAHLREVAAAVHSRWNASEDQPQLRFVNEEERVSAKARLALVTASTLVLKSGLGILGLAAPDETT